MHVIDIGKDFSTTPAGRFYTDGPNSGQRFRDELLVPALKQFPMVEVNLDSALGFGSSFLDEAFGGAIRENLLTKGVLTSKLTIRSSRKIYEKKIWQYIENALPKQDISEN